MIPGFASSRRRFKDLSEQEILALAISSEEDDARIYRLYAERVRKDFPASAAVFDGMALEEDEHRRRLIERHVARFGEVIPLIRREHVAGFYARKPVWLVENLPLETMRAEAEVMEHEAANFYTLAAKATTDADTRLLLGDLAAAEQGHEQRAGELAEANLSGEEGEEVNGRAVFAAANGGHEKSLRGAMVCWLACSHRARTARRARVRLEGFGWLRKELSQIKIIPIHICSILLCSCVTPKHNARTVRPWRMSSKPGEKAQKLRLAVTQSRRPSSMLL